MQKGEDKIAGISLKREDCMLYGLYLSKDQLLFHLNLKLLFFTKIMDPTVADL